MRLVKLVLTKRSIVALLCFVAGAGSICAHAQVVPSAETKGWSLSAGAEGSAFKPDYTNGGAAKTSPKRLYGIDVYADWKLRRWVQIEGEARFLEFNQSTGVSQTTYQIGPRIPIVTFKRLTPYGKLLFGFGTRGTPSNGIRAVLAYGGGIDYRLSRKFTIRAIDAEYQQWFVKDNGLSVPIHPYGISAGMSYRIF